MPRTTERLIQLLETVNAPVETVNAPAVNNDDGKPGEFLAELCKEAADRLRELSAPLTVLWAGGFCDGATGMPMQLAALGAKRTSSSSVPIILRHFDW
jgi:hypothetical protein